MSFYFSDETYLKMVKDRAFDEGFNAHKQGLDRSANPYDRDSRYDEEQEAYWAWDNGYDEFEKTSS